MIIVKKENTRLEEKVIVMNMCVKDPKTGEIICVEDGFEMIVRKHYPKGLDRNGRKKHSHYSKIRSRNIQLPSKNTDRAQVDKI